MTFLHEGDKIVEENNGRFYVRGQRQFEEDRVEKTKSRILSEDGIDLDDFNARSANAETYEKPRVLSHREGLPPLPPEEPVGPVEE